MLENKKKCIENKSDQQWQAETLLWEVGSLEEETERRKQSCKNGKRISANQSTKQNPRNIIKGFRTKLWSGGHKIKIYLILY